MQTADESMSAPAPLSTKLVLARINARLALLRSWLSHDHTDEPYWWARRTTVPAIQRERLALRPIANLLHVERATSRGRIHSAQFETLDEQRAYLAERERTLLQLREGTLPT